MFYDLNVRLETFTPSTHVLEEIFTQLTDYGYRGVAITFEVDDSVFASKKDKSKKKKEPRTGDPIPKPIDVKSFKDKFPKIKIYKRINIVLSESENIRKIFQSNNIRLYDLISFQPENQSVLKSLASVADLDIISYNPETKCSLTINRKLYNQFVNQNVYFELMYVPAVVSQSARRNLIALSHTYHAIGKSKNIIVTSGSFHPQHIRGPYDVINFNLLFGLSEEQAKRAIARNCEKLLLRARKQRQGKGMIEISSTNTGSSETKNVLPLEPNECEEVVCDVTPMEVIE